MKYDTSRNSNETDLVASVIEKNRLAFGVHHHSFLHTLIVQCAHGQNTGENRRFEQQIFAASVFESAFHMFSCNILG